MTALLDLLPDDQAVFELTRDALDDLPYGVITLDRRGMVLRYNQAEAALARRTSVQTIGLNFFADVAPCTNVQAFKGRFDDFAAQTGSGVERFDFSFAFRWGRHDVTITLLRKAEHDEINLLVRGRSLATIDPSTVAVQPDPARMRRQNDRNNEAAQPVSPVGRELSAPLSWSLNSAADTAWRARIHPDDRSTVRHSIAEAREKHAAYAVEYRVVDGDRKQRVYLEQGHVDATGTGSVTVIDVSAQRGREEELWRVAHYDALTGLASRTLLLRRIEEAAIEATASKKIAAILFMDLDHFKAVNDTFGHDVGDDLLRALALRLGECVRGGDTVARLDGDEFVLLFTELDDIPSVEGAVRRVLTAVARPIEISGRKHHVTASIGVSMAPYHGSNAPALLQAADSAMYASKASARNGFQWFTAEMSQSIALNLRVEDDLRQALERGELEVHYQPIIDAVDNRIVAAEALVRWNHPGRGLVMPMDFISVAERSGLIAPLGDFVLRDACVRIKEWTAQGHDMRVCVNVSTAQFRQKNFAEMVRTILEETGAPPERIELELTESMMIEGFAETIDVLTSLKLLRLRLAIDDFGTGYSSLSYLKYLPIDTLKLDRAFVSDIAEDVFDRAIATAVLALAHELKLECIAEGIETRAQMDLLKGLGCRHMQGYLFGRPQPVDTFNPALPALR